MIEFNTNDPPKLKSNKKHIESIIDSKIITSDYINYIVSDNNLTSFIVKEGIV